MELFRNDLLLYSSTCSFKLFRKNFRKYTDILTFAFNDQLCHYSSPVISVLCVDTILFYTFFRLPSSLIYMNQHKTVFIYAFMYNFFEINML